MELTKNEFVWVLIIGVAGVLAGNFLFSPFYALTISSLLTLYKYNSRWNIAYFDFVILLLLIFLFALGQTAFDWLVHALLMGFIMWFTFITFKLTNTFSKNRLGIFTMLIYWAGFSYLALLFTPYLTELLIGSKFTHTAFRWNYYTGIIGVDAWVFLGGIAFYYILFKDKALFKGLIRWRTALAFGLLLSIPFLANLFIPSDVVALNEHKVMDILFKDGLYQGRYIEWFGRTCLWVTVFVVIYAFVKRKAKYEAN